MRILLVTDSFPPNCGGSGWSTYELARGLRARGHDIALVQPRPRQRSDATRQFDGFLVEEIASPAPPVPFVRNYFKNERLWAKLADHLAARLAASPVDVVHAQHVLTTVPAIAAARRSATPVVATVRDYWPVCYWSDLIRDFAADALCPECTTGNMQQCLRGRAGPAGVAAWPLIPYMRGNLQRKRTGLAEADAVIAVSSAIFDDLRARAPELGATRMVQIPNPVDVEGLRALAAERGAPSTTPYALFVGKLEPNKGAGLLVDVAARAGLRMPLVVVGDGRLRGELERRAGRDPAVDLRVQGWLPREEVLAWMRHASVLVFPSRGPESLSRVLLEAAALGVPMAAMNTGGTRDIVINGVTGLLSEDADGLARDVARLQTDRDLACRLAGAARAHVEAVFDASAVLPRIDALYEELTRAAGRG
jgi:glycogen(starch) synthase